MADEAKDDVDTALAKAEEAVNAAAEAGFASSPPDRAPPQLPAAADGEEEKKDADADAEADEAPTQPLGKEADPEPTDSGSGKERRARDRGD